ncbi:hypothetical protein K2173_022067 [Erythroxylum novogranatense]|uniref:glutathione transferase n=1 Tax=Erythroxylum novogranatense TaxID=1862640 RepID=A0AAV8T3S7_9ROSI|nr:hypothetical protein K2173_022067 [Erythroxylum novogranatense]
MASGDVKLIGAWASPFVLRARVALNIKAIDYQFIQEQLGAKSQLLLESNPVYKKIPVLIHEDKPICESLIIVQYIDEAWSSGPSILPTDPYDRTVARFWAAYIDDKWFPAMKGLPTAKGDEERKALLEQLGQGLTHMEEVYVKSSQGKAFFGGDKIGLLDIAFGSFLGWLRVTEKLDGVKLLDKVKTPGLVKWSESFCSSPAVKDVLPETDKLAEFAKIVRAKLRGSS